MPFLYNLDMENSNTQNVKKLIVFIYDRNGKASKHSHEFLEIGYVISGSGIYYSENTQYKINPGDVMITMPGVEHLERITEDEQADIIYLGISKDILQIMSLMELSLTKVVFAGDTPEVFNLFRNILIESVSHNYKYEYVIDHYAATLMIILARIAKKSENNISVSTNLSGLLEIRKEKIVDEIINYFDANLTKDIDSIEIIASKFFISTHHLMKLFKNSTGYSIKQYYLSLKIKKAKEILVLTDNKIESISEMLNFVDISYFYRVFKKATGLTPLMYRMKMRKSLIP